MTKQIRFKDGKVLKIESCVKCPIYWSENDLGVSCKTAISGVMTPEHKTCVSPYCPLQDWQDQPAEQSIICTASKLQGACPACPQYATCKDPDKPTLDSRVLYRNDPAAPKEQGTTTGTGGYLDKVAVFNALEDLKIIVDQYAEGRVDNILELVERGHFDAKLPPVWCEAFQAGVDTANKVLAEKDAEIAHLKDEIEKCNVIIQGYYADIVRLKELVENRERSQESQNVDIMNLEEKIKKKDIDIARLTNDKSLCIQELDRFKKKYDGRVTEVVRLNDRIRQQDQELKGLAESLREKQVALADLKDSLNPDRRACINCGNTECPILIGADQTCWKPMQREPPKDEPELWICPNAGSIAICGPCDHSRPHEKTDLCSNVEVIESLPDPECKHPCIPVKKEPTVPQMQQSARTENTVAGALHYDIEVQGRRIDAYAKKQVNFDMRLDKLEKEIAAIREKVSKP
jgi:peptidoglycan hydrolase CwlO-like protein